MDDGLEEWLADLEAAAAEGTSLDAPTPQAATTADPAARQHPSTGWVAEEAGVAGSHLRLVGTAAAADGVEAEAAADPTALWGPTPPARPRPLAGVEENARATAVGRRLLLGPPGAGRWIRIGVIAAVVWIAVAGVLMNGEDAATTPPGDPSADAAATAPPPDPAGSRTAETAAPEMPPPPASDLPLPPAPEVVPPAAALPDAALASAATLALRRRITSDGPQRRSYLEWALVVESRPLSEVAVLAVLDAVWLTGDATRYDRAHQGRWAVPLTPDGTPLDEPWLLAEDIAAHSQALAPPPTGRHRLEEVAAALAAAGWQQVDPVAAAPHPSVPGVVVAEMEGVSPGGTEPTRQVVWLAEAGADGLRLLGVP